MSPLILGAIAFLYLFATVSEWSAGRPMWALVYFCFAVSNCALLMIGLGER